MQGSAAAPIARSVLEFFLEFDIPIYELYGMSESSGPQTLSLIGQFGHVTSSPGSCDPSPLCAGRHKTGSTGQVMAGAELKIDNPGLCLLITQCSHLQSELSYNNQN